MAEKLSERLEALMALVEKATPGVWEADGDDASFHKITICGNDRYACSVGIWQTPRVMGLHDEPQRVANASAIVAAVNFLRDHGPALAEMARRMEWAPVAVVECNDAKGAWLVTVDDAPLYKGQRVRLVPEPPEAA